MAIGASAFVRRWVPFSDTIAEHSLRSMATKAYVGGVIATGAALLIQFAPLQYPRPWLALTLLGAALILSAFKLRLPLGRGNSTMSMAYAVDFVALVSAGPDLAMVIAAAGVVLQCTVRVRRSQPLHRAAFSVSSVVIAVQAAGWAWQAFGGSSSSPSIQTLAVPLSAAATTYFAVNTALVAGAIALSSAVSAARQWYREFFWSAPAYFLSAAVAGMVAMVMAYEQYVLMPLVASPLYLSYRAYQMSVRRLEEERRHAQELTGMIATTQQALARATQSEAALAAEKERLALESARLNATLRTISDGVISVDRNGMMLLMNEGAQRLSGIAPGSTTDGRLCSLLVSVGFSGDECETALARVLVDGVPARLRRDLGSGTTLRLIEVTGTPTRGDCGVTGAVFVLRDISDLARIEHERAKAVRLESLGVLAGGLAHDFNNILMGVVGNLSLAQSMVDPDSDLSTRLSSAASACARARGVTNQLLTFAKGGAPVKTTTSVRELATECTRFALSGSPVAPRFDIADDVWEAEVDTVQVGQVIQNLVLNGMQAMPRGGVLEVSLRNVTLEADTLPPQTSVTPGKYVCLTVRDSGHGIPSDTLGRIFEPYFTTKEKGSGLGLAISYSIVRAHNGAITVESEPGIGSRFTVYLPASSTRVALAGPVSEDIPASFQGRVLIMDDEEMVAEVAQEMLESIGYTATLTSNGHAAIATFKNAEERNEPFDAVVLDLTVPGGMGGAEAVGHIKQIRGTVPVLVMSGYADDSVLARYGEYGFDGVLPKPFMIPDLRRVLHEAVVIRAANTEERQGVPGDREEKEVCVFS
jgi:signal transduction histidine kinase/FixJ family two-component response regulator